ncbi:hypothetical protein GCM10027040_10930 [Halomonas shantousis]
MERKPLNDMSAKTPVAEQRKQTLMDIVRDSVGSGEAFNDSDDMANLDETELWFLKAFATLSKTRSTDPQPYPIPFGDIQSYLEAQELPVEADEFVDTIQAMDAVWLKEQAEHKGKP